MRLQSLHLENFKNYHRLSADFSGKDVVILIGMNGQGKTNFLESIVLLSLSKNYYSTALADFVNWSARGNETGLPEYFRIRGEYVSSNGKNNELELACGNGKNYTKVLKVNGLKVKPHEYIGHLKIVLFTPQDLNMVFLAPQIRRRYVNIFISQIDPEYLRNLSEYQVILKHRNKLLGYVRENSSRVMELDYWDEKLSNHGAYLLWKRRLLFRDFNRVLSENYGLISSQTVDYKLVWKKDWDSSNLDTVRESFSNYLFEKRSRDIECGSTLGGPHREDFVFEMNGRNLADFASRGECRSAVLALKLAEADFIKTTTGDSPVVLFDDVFSELDVDRQKNLLKLFSAEQVFISTTHLDFSRENASVFEVKEGVLREIT